MQRGVDLAAPGTGRERDVVDIRTRMASAVSARSCGPCPPCVATQKRITSTNQPRQDATYLPREVVQTTEASPQFRAIATRYDKTARNFLAAIHPAASTIWLN
ncbi:MAG: hypothetical protein M0002_21355 [Rhodospirillales bacterium]|nr:hypothetical protein [Rhodospirillales bacterium]